MEKKTTWERIRTAFYIARTSGEQALILLRDETVSDLLSSSQVSFCGDLLFEQGGEKIAVGIDSSRIAGPHAYVRTFNGQPTCAVPKLDAIEIQTLTL